MCVSLILLFTFGGMVVNCPINDDYRAVLDSEINREKHRDPRQLMAQQVEHRIFSVRFVHPLHFKPFVTINFTTKVTRKKDIVAQQNDAHVEKPQAIQDSLQKRQHFLSEADQLGIFHAPDKTLYRHLYTL